MAKLCKPEFGLDAFKQWLKNPVLNKPEQSVKIHDEVEKTKIPWNFEFQFLSEKILSQLLAFFTLLLGLFLLQLLLLLKLLLEYLLIWCGALKNLLNFRYLLFSFWNLLTLLLLNFIFKFLQFLSNVLLRKEPIRVWIIGLVIIRLNECATWRGRGSGPSWLKMSMCLYLVYENKVLLRLGFLRHNDQRNDEAQDGESTTKPSLECSLTIVIQRNRRTKHIVVFQNI